eukprot:1184695-Prorocentrum_minimum.AAC.1
MRLELWDRVVERYIRAPCDVVHQQRAGCAAIVRPRDGAERLLPRLHARATDELLVRLHESC